MENLSRLKELEYINLALNNISVIENIEGCESLNKLDLTLNFIDIEDLEISMMNLKEVHSMRLLYMTGNPCTDWPNYRRYVIAMCPQLTSLDGTEISHHERIQCGQALNELSMELHDLAVEKLRKVEAGEVDVETTYTKESRIEQAKETEKHRLEKEESQTKN